MVTEFSCKKSVLSPLCIPHVFFYFYRSATVEVNTAIIGILDFVDLPRLIKSTHDCKSCDLDRSHVVVTHQSEPTMRCSHWCPLEGRSYSMAYD